MDINLEKENIKQRYGYRYGYIPKTLEVKDRPELSIFPLNVLMARYTIRDGKTVLGNVLYEPDLSSFDYDSKLKVVKMDYYNKYNHDYWLTMAFDLERKTRQCTKYFSGKEVGVAEGGEDWERFFIQVSFLGFEQNETCVFEEVPEG